MLRLDTTSQLSATVDNKATSIPSSNMGCHPWQTGTLKGELTSLQEMQLALNQQSDYLQVEKLTKFEREKEKNPLIKTELTFSVVRGEK